MHVRVALLEALELLADPGLGEPRRDVGRTRGRQDAVAELRELAADVDQGGVRPRCDSELASPVRLSRSVLISALLLRLISRTLLTPAG